MKTNTAKSRQQRSGTVADPGQGHGGLGRGERTLRLQAAERLLAGVT